jgi:hypothetical protein
MDHLDFRGALADLGWTIYGSGARLGISPRHARRLASGDIRVTETIKRLLEAHLELKALYEQRNNSWASKWRDPSNPCVSPPSPS